MAVLLDTSALYTLLDRDDHQEAFPLAQGQLGSLPSCTVWEQG